MSSSTYFPNFFSHTNNNELLGRCLGFVVMLSGISGLGYQIAWSKLLSLSLGHEIIAILAVLAAFFIGLALGGLALSRRIKYTYCPQVWYALCELIIGMWSLLLIILIPYFNLYIADLIGAQPSTFWHWLVAFTGTLVLLLPATFCMGATLPAIEGVFAKCLNKQNRVAGLYGLNTFGAMLGVLVATFYLIPKFGLSSTLIVFAAINFLCALAMILVWRPSPNQNLKHKHNSIKQQETSLAQILKLNKLLFVLFTCGLLGLAYEVLIIRALSQILENTVYSFAAILTVYLLATAVGASYYQLKFSTNKAYSKGQAWRSLYAHMLCLTAISCLLGIAALWLSKTVYTQITVWLGYGSGAAIIAELSVALLVLFLPAFVMGMLFSHLIKPIIVQTGLGNGLAANTFGSAAAPFLFGLIILPSFGSFYSLIGVVFAYLLLIFVFPPTPSGLSRQFLNRNMIRKNKRSKALLLTAFALLTVLLITPLPQNYVTWNSHATNQEQTIFFKEGVMAAIEVSQDAAGYKHLSVNNHYTMGGTASRFSDHRQTHLPFLLHGNPESALYLGLGTGITMNAAQYYPHTRVTGVELIPELIDVLPEFNVDINSSKWRHKPTLISADARRYMLSTQDQYDVIVAEIFHPSRDGAGALYTVEHFQQIREKLNPNGLVCQWLPLFQLDIPTFKSILRSFLQVFPDAQMHLGHFSLRQPIICLIGSKNNTQINPPWLLRKVKYVPLQQELIRAKLNSDLALLGGYLASGQQLSSLAGEGIYNTDDHPFITYQAPSFVYQSPQPHGLRLLEIISQIPPTDASQLTNDAAFAAALEDYWQARNLFLSAGVQVDASDELKTIFLKTAPQLIEAVKISANFEPAYRALLGMAQQLASSDQVMAVKLLDELTKAAPMINEAQALKNQILVRQ